MKNRRLRFTATAQEHVRREKAWWLANRDHTDVFTEELYLRRVAAHLYYTFDSSEVIIRALWGSRRERGPRI